MAIPLKKKLSIVATVTIILITTVVGYFVIGLKKGPYPVNDFESFTYKWGMGDSLINSYTSINGNYQYLNKRDSLIKTNVKLRVDDIIFLHHKLSELGLWSLPTVIGVKDNNAATPVYELQFNYKKKVKKIVIYSGDKDVSLLLDSAMRLKTVVQQVVDEAESRYHK